MEIASIFKKSTWSYKKGDKVDTESIVYREIGPLYNKFVKKM